MKNIIILILGILFTLTSCNQKVENTQPILEVKSQSVQKDTVIENKQLAIVNKETQIIASILQGVWLPQCYIQDIYETGSAFVASRSIPTISEIQIDPDNLNNDTLYVVSSLSNHEGYTFKIWFDKTENEITINSNLLEWKSEKFDFDFTYQVNKDTILNLRTKDKSGKIIKTIKYLRVRNKDYISNYGGRGYEYLARKVLLNGSYEIFDSIESSHGVVIFNADDGSITGDFKHGFYEFLTDYSGGPTFEGDQIFLRSSEEDYNNREILTLQYIYDTLALYTTEVLFENDINREVLRERLYSLVEIKN